MSIEYGTDVVPAPLHLSVSFFEEVLENALHAINAQIRNVQINMGSNTGENYCSQIYRAKVHYTLNVDNDDDAGDTKATTTLQCLSLIIKSMPHSDVTQFLQDLQVFLKEKTTYQALLPRLELLAPAPAIKFGPRLYHSLKEPVNTLVFEDLNTSHFEMASRETGLDMTHARLVVQRLAQFHGASMLLATRDADIMRGYSSGMLKRKALERDDSMLMRYFGGNAGALVELVGQWPGYEDIASKLRRYAANLRENLLRSQAAQPGELCVLNHGDLWVNNMLFQYDAQRQPRDVVFVDFQMSIWRSPGIDLNYFFYTSLQLDVLKQHHDELLCIYHSMLCKTLRSGQYIQDVPSYEQIVNEVRRRAAYGFFANYGIYPTVCMDKQTSSDNSLDNFANEEFARNKLKQMFATPRLAESLRYTLRQFDALGVWD